MKLLREAEIAQEIEGRQNRGFLQTKMLDAGGIATRYADEGQGEAVLLIHGFPETLQGWRHNVPDLAKNFRVIAPDTIGSGGTAKSRDCRYASRDFTKHLISFLDALQIESVHIVGTDVGLIWAADLAASYPQRVNSVVLMDGTIYIEDTTSWEINVMKIPIIGEIGCAMPFFGLLIKEALRKGFYNKIFASQELFDECMWSLNQPGARRAALQMLRSVIRDCDELTEKLKNIKTPTFLIAAENDSFFPRRAFERLSKLLGNIPIQFVAEAGHFLPEEKPEQFNDLIYKFIQNID